MRTSRMMKIVVATGLLVGGTACSGVDGRPKDGQAGTPPTAEPSAGALAITATEYAFEAPATIEGGLVEVSFSNVGDEPHFVGFAKVAPGKLFTDVRSALTAGSPPGGPPPFEPFAGVPAADPGVEGGMVLDLPAGTYALFCSIPAPDGMPHVAKGMIRELTVAAGEGGRLPDATHTVDATDFAFAANTTDFVAGTQVVKLRNQGRQLHEINLVELSSGSSIDDALAWLRSPKGRPPYRSLGGVAVRAGREASTELTLTSGVTYALVCVIPDALGDRGPHALKGMTTSGFQV